MSLKHNMSNTAANKIIAVVMSAHHHSLNTSIPQKVAAHSPHDLEHPLNEHWESCQVPGRAPYRY